MPAQPVLPSAAGADDVIVRLSARRGLRLGIMGGAFDPIHIAHLVTAEEALVQFHLDEMVFMPAGNHPHKPRRLAPPDFRHLLVSVATASHPHFHVSRYELDRNEVGYTVDTLEYLHCTLAADAKIFFVTGADAVLDILTWKNPDRVLEICTLIAATRPGYDLSRLAEVLQRLRSSAGAQSGSFTVEIMEIPALAISSSMIRGRLSSRLAVRYLLPDGVAELIEKAGQYQDPAGSGCGSESVPGYP
jgi:nicotinate-nucleotide adenylyltransferase